MCLFVTVMCVRGNIREGFIQYDYHKFHKHLFDFGKFTTGNSCKDRDKVKLLNGNMIRALKN